jgi:hypothetical protein
MSQGLHSHEKINLIQSALTECKREKNSKFETNCFTVNFWFDEECKTTWKNLKESSQKEINIKAYKKIVRNKKDYFMISRREELIFLGKNNPKLFWKELQMRKKQTKNNITTYQWFEYEKKIYEKDPKVDPPPLVNVTTKLFTVHKIEVSIKNLGVGKTKYLVELQEEYLKWGSKTLAPHIMKIFNNII